MKTVSLIQGSPAWCAHRAQHWNASDAPAMLGVSPHKSRKQFLREYKTGISQEFDAATQRRFDDGHRFEALARPLAEAIIGEDLFPVTGVDGHYSASFDGLTMLEDTVWEHKTATDSLIAAIVECSEGRAELPEHYRIQMEQQLMISGAWRCLFMATRWDKDDSLGEHAHCWYYPDTELRARIVAGWAQFARDLADYQHAPADAPKPVGRTPDSLPSLRIEAKGMVTASNIAEFREHAMAVLGQINRDLQTDEDFASAEATVKWCSGVEDRLASAKANVLAQMADVDAVCRTIDDVQAETRRIRLELDKLVKAEKENRKAQIVQAGVDAIRAHYAAVSQTLGAYAVNFVMPASLPAEIGAAIKGLKTLTSMREKIDAAVANAKIAASQKADAIRVNAAILDQHKDHAFLFTDCSRIVVEKSADDLRNLIAARIAEHTAREAAKLEAERDRIRAEECARIERERTAGNVQPAAPAATVAGIADSGIAHAAAVGSANDHATIKLGDVNAAIAPLTITAEGLASIGFASCGQDRAAKLYRAQDLLMIMHALSDRLKRQALKAAA